MKTVKRITILAVVAMLAALATVALAPKERIFSGLSRTQVREVREAVARYALPSYSQCFSWNGLRYLARVDHIHQRWHIDDMRKEGDGSIQVRYTVHYSKESLTNSVRVQKGQGIWTVTPDAMYFPPR